MERPEKRSNELIKRRKKKIIIKKSILMLSFLIVVLVTLCFKLPFFDVETISVQNNSFIDSEAIVKLSGIRNGNNIFYINKKRAENNILTNGYISKVEIKKKLPNVIEINIKEREAVLYFMKDNKFIILDKDGTVLDERDNVDNMELVKVDGVRSGNTEVGKVVNLEDERIKKLMIQFARLVKRNISGVKLDNIDLTNFSDIKIYSSQLCFKIGDGYEIEDKLNKALNIAAKDEIRGKKGYIDVSFEGNPVIHMD